MTTLVRASGLSGYTLLVENLGGDPRQLAQACGIDPSLLGDEEALIPYRQFIHLIEDTAAELQAPNFGLRLAAVQDVGILGPLAVAIQNASNVREAISCAADYIFVQSAALQLEIEEQGERTRLGIVINLNNMPHSSMRQAEDLAIALVHRTLLMLAEDGYQLQRVELPHNPVAGELVIFQRYQ